MPQIVEGGKWVYGWVRVSKTGRIRIPEEALKDYEFRPSDKIITIYGSRKSGGFGLTKTSLIKETVLSKKLGYQGQKIEFKIYRNGQIRLSLEFLRHHGLKSDDRLLLVRGSRYALGFVTKGPIFEEALKHPELPTFI
jgi:bifunctional DNA-binding transcriptional regulator/antitoxin component of YhaV-PrlF toxin-antitoxin module